MTNTCINCGSLIDFHNHVESNGRFHVVPAGTGMMVVENRSIQPNQLEIKCVEFKPNETGVEVFGPTKPGRSFPGTFYNLLD